MCFNTKYIQNCTQFPAVSLIFWHSFSIPHISINVYVEWAFYCHFNKAELQYFIFAQSVYFLWLYFSQSVCIFYLQIVVVQILNNGQAQVSFTLSINAAECICDRGDLLSFTSLFSAFFWTVLWSFNLEMVKTDNYSSWTH